MKGYDSMIGKKFRVVSKKKWYERKRKMHLISAGYVDEMENLEGKTCRIVKVNNDTGCMRIDLDNGRWWWSMDMLERAVYDIE